MPDTIMNDSTARPSIKNLATALCKAQSEMEGAKKDVTNPHFNRKYADLASVWSAIREPLTKNGLSIVQLLRSMPGGVEVETILMHNSGEQISDVFGVPASKADAQGYGSAATYARRYSLMAMVGVAPEDDDGNAAAAGAPGSAGAGGDFRPAGRRQSSWGAGGKAAAIDEAERDGTYAPHATKGKLQGSQTPEDEREAKLKAAADKRIDALKVGAPWTRTALDQFWNADKKWIDWMADPANEALKHYERFTDAFADAEISTQAVA